MIRHPSPALLSPSFPIPRFPTLHSGMVRGMPAAMKRARVVLSLVLVTSVLRADFDPDAWRSVALGTATTNNNEWYSYPDSAGNPRILVKSSSTNGPRKLLTGGPPVWVESTSANTALTGQGVFVPISTGGGYLVAPHANKLQVAVFGPGGTSATEVIDSNTGAYTGISAELDANGVLHVGYVWNSSYICYARRSGGTPWLFTSINLPSTTIQDTAVVPVPTTVSGQTYDADLYYCATSSNVRTLWKSRPGIVNSQLLIQWGANPRVNVENFVGATLRGSRVGNIGRVYYFGSNNSSSWKFKRYQGGTSTDLETAGNVDARSIHVAVGPDGKQRVAWYDRTNQSIHYLKPNAVDIPALAGSPVETTGNQANADLCGMHFGPDGMPYLLYRTTLAAGFVAFPNDNFDTNGNGRPQILDAAFNSNSAGLGVLPVKAAFPGVANSANRFKIIFPTIGTANTNGLGGVQTSSENLLYKVEVSPDLVNWTPLNTGSAIAYTAISTVGTLKTYVGVINETAPGIYPKRFARLAVTRLNYPY